MGCDKRIEVCFCGCTYTVSKFVKQFRLLVGIGTCWWRKVFVYIRSSVLTVHSDIEVAVMYLMIWIS